MINRMIERLNVMLIKIEIFVFVNFLCSFVNDNGYFNDAISLLWFPSSRTKNLISYSFLPLSYREVMKKLPLSKYLQTMRYAATNYLSHECIYPFYASFKVTHICSLRCSFCNVWKEKTPDLTKEGVFKVIDNIANSSIIVLSLEGGDPLMRKDLGEILQYAHQKPFYLFFTTNGHLLEKRPMEEYGKHIDYLHISIDEGHDNLAFFDRLEEFQIYGPETVSYTHLTLPTKRIV